MLWVKEISDGDDCHSLPTTALRDDRMSLPTFLRRLRRRPVSSSTDRRGLRASRRRRLFGERLERRQLLVGTVLEVNTLLDVVEADDVLSLREAIRLVNHEGDAVAALGRELTEAEAQQVQGEGPFGLADEIRFAADLFGDVPSVIELAAPLSVTASVAIGGPGADGLVIDASTIPDVIASPAFEFDFTVIASDLSPDLRLFGSQDPADAPFTVLRYGEGTIELATDLSVLDSMIWEPNLLWFEFGGYDPEAPGRAATLVEFDDGTDDLIARQVYRPNGSDDDPTVDIYFNEHRFATGELVEVSLEIQPGNPPATSSSPGNPSSLRLTELLDEKFAHVWQELMRASGDSGIVPFSLSTFDYLGDFAGVSDAEVFYSVGETQWAPLTGGRVFEILGDGATEIDVALAGMTLRGGKSVYDFEDEFADSGDDWSGYGGAIMSIGANLSLTAVAIRGNSAESGAGVYLQEGELRIRESLFEHNWATSSGGGLLLDRGTGSVVDSVIADNLSGLGGGMAIHDGSDIWVTRSSIIRNHARWDGGGIDNYDSVTTLDNSTVAENRAGFGAGIWTGGEASGLMVLSSTLVLNRAVADVSDDLAWEVGDELPGGGIYFDSFQWIEDDLLEPLPPFLVNSIIAGNTAVAFDGEVFPSDLAGGDAMNGSKNNIIGDPGTSGGLTNGVQGNLVGRDQMSSVLPIEEILRPELGFHGGRTPNYLPVPGSPAIDAGTPDFLISAETEFDQRGPGFPRVIGELPDIGSVEYAASLEVSVSLESSSVRERVYGDPVGLFTYSDDVMIGSAVTVSDPRFRVQDDQLMLAEDEWVLHDEAAQVELTVTWDVPGVGLVEHPFVIEVIVNATPWQNPEVRYDVAANGRVTARDALLVINFLGRDSGELEGRDRTPRTPYYDVNGDGKVTALDALLVINQLARSLGSSSAGEGEVAVALSQEPQRVAFRAEDERCLLDEWFHELGQSPLF